MQHKNNHLINVSKREVSMARILAVANQKGGEGKSTLFVHCAFAAVEAGLRVLLVDLDLQGSASLSFLPVPGAAPGLVASQLFRADAIDAKPEVLSELLHIIRADDVLQYLVGDDNNKEMLSRPSRHLKKLAGDYDLILLDTPGTLGFNPPMTISALVAADAVVCPFSIGMYESKALGDLLARLKSIKSSGFNPRLALLGLVPSKIHTTSKPMLNALESLRAQYGNAILPGRLSERAAVRQAIAARRPVWDSAKTASQKVAAQEWRDMCHTILGKLGEIRK
jgi:chromosome partitioning protein